MRRRFCLQILTRNFFAETTVERTESFAKSSNKSSGTSLEATIAEALEGAEDLETEDSLDKLKFVLQAWIFCKPYRLENKRANNNF